MRALLVSLLCGSVAALSVSRASTGVKFDRRAFGSASSGRPEERRAAAQGNGRRRARCRDALALFAQRCGASGRAEMDLGQQASASRSPSV